MLVNSKIGLLNNCFTIFLCRQAFPALFRKIVCLAHPNILGLCRSKGCGAPTCCFSDAFDNQDVLLSRLCFSIYCLSRTPVCNKIQVLLLIILIAPNSQACLHFKHPAHFSGSDIITCSCTRVLPMNKNDLSITSLGQASVHSQQAVQL